jgi:hypothetical protein
VLDGGVLSVLSLLNSAAPSQDVCTFFCFFLAGKILSQEAIN